MGVHAGAAAAMPLALLLAGCQRTPPPRPVVSPPVVSRTPPAQPPAPVQESSAASPTPLTTPSQHLYAARCTAAQLRLSSAGEISPATEQNPLAVMLTNVSRAACHLDGYPGVALIDAQGGVLPLQYVRHGDQMVTSRAPTWVDLAPGASAYVTVNKNTCETGSQARAVSIRVIPPDDTAALSMGVGARVLASCGAGDPGSRLAISPVEPTLDATLASYG